jgi:hypothetical protein
MTGNVELPPHLGRWMADVDNLLWRWGQADP